MIKNPFFILNIDGQTVGPEITDDVMEIRYIDSLDDNVDSLTMLFSDSYLNAKGNGLLLENEIFKKGTRVEVAFGNDKDQDFVSFLRTGNMEIDSIGGTIGRESTISFHAMSMNSVNNSFLTKISISRRVRYLRDFLEDVIKNSGYEILISDFVPNPKLKNLSFKNMTRADILMDLADKYGLILKITNNVDTAGIKTRIVVSHKKTFEFQKSSLTFDGSKKDLNLIDFTFEQTSRLYGEVLVKFYNARRRKLWETENVSPSLDVSPAEKAINTEIWKVDSLKEAKDIAQQRVNKQEIVNVEFMTNGSNQMVAGQVFVLENFNSIIDGKYLVTKAQHNFTYDEGWRVSINATKIRSLEALTAN